MGMKNTTLPTHRLFGTIYHDTYATMTLVVEWTIHSWFDSQGAICQRHVWERLFKRRFI